MGIQKEVARVQAVSMVKPAKPTPPQVLYLSGIDQALKYARPSRTILFFPGPENATEAAASIKAGLAAMLVEFYPLAGRLIDDNGRFALDCNDAGVEVVEAESDLPFNKFVKDNYCVHSLFRQLVGLDSRVYCDHIEDPLVTIQITSFVGGITLGIAISHVAADGYCFWYFVKSLAQVCTNQPISTHPLHHRTLLKPDTFLLNKVPATEQRLVQEEVVLYNGDMDPSITGEDDRKITDLMSLPPEDLHQTMMHFDKGMIEKLREECGANQEGRFSNFEVMAAYLWRRITVAQAWNERVRVDFRIPLDIRARMVPALTPSYYGNAVVGSTVASTAGELASESLGATAAKIRACVRSMDDRYIKKALIARENMDLRKLTQGAVVLSNVRNASRFPVKDCDFGWGAPAAVRPPWEWREGEFTWYPNLSHPGTIDVFVGLSSSTHARFSSPDLYPSDPLPHLLCT